MDRLLTPREVSDMWQVSRATVYRMANEGEVGSVRVRGQLRFTPEQVRAFLAGEVATVTPLYYPDEYGTASLVQDADETARVREQLAQREAGRADPDATEPTIWYVIGDTGQRGRRVAHRLGDGGRPACRPRNEPTTNIRPAEPGAVMCARCRKLDA